MTNEQTTIHGARRTPPARTRARRSWRGRLRSERGTALIIALMATMLLTALGVAVVMVTTTETMITANYRAADEALYAADAAVERVVQDLLTVPRWDDILAGGLTSGFIDSTTSPQLVDGRVLNLTTETENLQADTDAANLWGADNPVWRLYAYSPVNNLIPGVNLGSPMYVAVWVADDPADLDGNPLVDSNGVLTLYSQAYGPGGVRKAVEVTVARTSSTEIERGMIAQRGQEELNQRARKAAVQTPGRALSSMRMGLDVGGMQ